MKKTFAILFAAALGFMAATSCIEDEYDLDKEIDKTIELKNFSVALNRTFTFAVQDILPSEYKNYSGDFVATLPDGVLGSFKVDGIYDELDDDYLFKQAIVTATIENGLPKPFTATAVALSKNGAVLDNITATLKSGPVPTGTSTITVEVKANSNMHFDAVKLELKMDETQVQFNSAQKVVVKNIVINFPNGIAKKD